MFYFAITNYTTYINFFKSFFVVLSCLLSLCSEIYIETEKYKKNMGGGGGGGAVVAAGGWGWGWRKSCRLCLHTVGINPDVIALSDLAVLSSCCCSLYTVQKVCRFYRPQPGCHLPNSPWAEII
jgi:hypothetical protein